MCPMCQSISFIQGHIGHIGCPMCPCMKLIL